MAYQRTEYHREVNRDEDSRDNKSGGWKSWFGLGDNKERDDDRGYSYSNTTTYRNPQSSYGYSSAPHPERSGYSGAPISTGYGTRGGYGYSTSDEVNRGPSWNTDRDYSTRAGYGGDRDVYYKQETRTYGGDRDNWTTSRPSADFHPSTGYSTSTRYPTTEYPTSRSYGFSGESRSPSRGYTTGGAYGYSSEHPSRSYPITGDREYSTSRTTEYPTTSRSYGFSGERDVSSRGYAGGYSGFSGDRDYTTSRGYGGESRGYTSGVYGGDRDYTRGSYENKASSYRY